MHLSPNDIPFTKTVHIWGGGESGSRRIKANKLSFGTSTRSVFWYLNTNLIFDAGTLRSIWDH